MSSTDPTGSWVGLPSSSRILITASTGVGWTRLVRLEDLERLRLQRGEGVEDPLRLRVQQAGRVRDQALDPAAGLVPDLVDQGRAGVEERVPGAAGRSGRVRVRRGGPLRGDEVSAELGHALGSDGLPQLRQEDALLLGGVLTDVGDDAGQRVLELGSPGSPRWTMTTSSLTSWCSPRSASASSSRPMATSAG